MKNVTDMAKPSAEQVTRCLNAIYDPFTYRREIDYFRFRDNNQNLNVGGGVPWLTLEAVKLTHGFHSSNNGSCLWTMLANTLTDFYPNWREHIGGSYMVYSPKIWNMYQEAAVEYFKITNHVHFENNYAIFMGKFISENHVQILECIYAYPNAKEITKPKVNWFTRTLNKILGR